MDCTNDRHPSSPLIQAANGDIYGTTSAGGAAHAGSVFMLNATRTIGSVYEFLSGSDLSGPVNIIQATDGNLYGTAFGAGTDHHGGIYKIDSSGNYSVMLGGSPDEKSLALPISRNKGIVDAASDGEKKGDWV
jgi:uncharacterized repeat protein (TIGR03803 family)